MFPIEVNPANVLATVLALGGIAGLTTAAIIGVRKNRHQHPSSPVAMELEEVDPDNLFMAFHGYEFKARVLGDVYHRGGKVDRRVTLSVVGEGSEEQVASIRKPYIKPTLRKIGKHPALAAPFTLSRGEAESIRDKFRNEHPDIYAVMAKELGLAPQDEYGAAMPPSSRLDKLAAMDADPSVDPVPEGVYWSIDAQQFYGPDDRPMDQGFTEDWWPRMSEFPQR